MIKSQYQSLQAQSRLEEISRQIETLPLDFSGMELEILRNPLVSEANELKEEITEFQQLMQLTLEQAVQGILQKPVSLENIGELLAKLRMATGLTQESLANMLGWHQSNLSRFESENYHSQTIAKVVEYADALDVWLYVAPSLDEKPGEVLFRSEEVPELETEYVSTLGDFAAAESTTTATGENSLVSEGKRLAYQELWPKEAECARA